MVSIFEQNGMGRARFNRPLSLWCQPCVAFVPSQALSSANTIATTPRKTTVAIQDLTSTPANQLSRLNAELLANNKPVLLHKALIRSIALVQTDTYKNLIPTLSILRNTRYESC